MMEQTIKFADLIGRTLLVGVTFYTYDNEFMEQKQFYGEVTEANERFISIRMQSGEMLTLPPDLRSTKVAKPGEYRLRSTGEIVINPDYLATWNVNRAQPNEKEE